MDDKKSSDCSAEGTHLLGLLSLYRIDRAFFQISEKGVDLLKDCTKDFHESLRGCSKIFLALALILRSSKKFSNE